ncbi:adenosylmethionine--8-amino-7-oxononanoate aminotransferase BioA [Oleiphilus sp. HI0081]|uniref:adenosylmethionine--8-amino-7-oxononanoate transaminase n=5 Tax=unclassified Oleiphilus TaxID=2631174 RepID=UPI0007C2D242|nr:adenosylmethionine--8-amino-7-oxononanoate transaminase [Oleiphilus sp. HI0132]KZY73288.1 adenosylmethionine--8-amino-7-oxononanoate aminotransferase BioA [Oleiphilus sp. HI0068]KZY76995.1 adenosylmethionine--8-amino-7-oxononanoate aminotransferase BioA [Oleiphilus sp. HI0069]KZY87066.1 adenosylmethionine--8-amino-7-oxononanoate aminotransferase BioA [Oleiphilus sp. HI0072]KZZ16067.1 adenosylmethionine--8-amino-7-oxononanoate aminotransferase BioA [Oleiphilus sp. HI0078]KZZ18293.1 adenosylm
MSDSTTLTALEIDRQHIWHPYSAIGAPHKIFHVESAQGCTLKLKDGTKLIDGMASWWSVIHGYNHPTLNEALKAQCDKMSHVMFGGLTHDPAIELSKLLVEISPQELEAVFFADSGSVAVEVAMKMAIQYWHDQGKPKKQRFISLLNGYHGDTFAAMSVCDPINGMHSLFSETLTKQFFVPAPTSKPGEACNEHDKQALRAALENHHQDTAAIIMEPIVQGAGGMRFYSESYLREARKLADEFGVLLIFDEIATGFGRTGKLFACEHAEVTPDILCLGKAITGGYMTLAATLTTRHISDTISSGNPGVFMHGPTFMANPLACAVALASVKQLLNSPWEDRLANIETKLKQGLSPCAKLDSVNEVRVLGGIGVVELYEAVNMAEIQGRFVEQGVWVRPFGKLVYVMPPYIMSDDELAKLCQAIHHVIKHYHQV